MFGLSEMYLSNSYSIIPQLTSDLKNFSGFVKLVHKVFNSGPTSYKNICQNAKKLKKENTSNQTYKEEKRYIKIDVLT